MIYLLGALLAMLVGGPLGPVHAGLVGGLLALVLTFIYRLGLDTRRARKADPR